MDDEAIKRVARWAYDATVSQVNIWAPVYQPSWDEIPGELKLCPSTPDPRPAWIDGARKAINGDT